MSKGRDNKPHIGIFGRRNNGKSSLINVLIGQDIAIVSEQPGTTTDPVKKSIEIFGIGPAIIIDTAGIDDEGELGEKRIHKSIEALKTVDCAILVISNNNFGEYEVNLIEKFEEYTIPYFILHNKADIEKLEKKTIDLIRYYCKATTIDFSAAKPENIEQVIDLLKKTIPETSYQQINIFEGLIKKNDLVLLVTPIDSEAPDGRMILPQMMAVRDALDKNTICILVRETELEEFFKKGIRPSIVVTDSQAFAFVNKIVPNDIPLTSFSILFARLKGDFDKYLEGSKKLDQLKDGDKILILESCTHRVSCQDIGRFKLPNWIKNYSNKNLEFEIVAGTNSAQHPIYEYALVIQCGGCMFTRKQILNKLKPFIDAGVPVSNYGLAIAFMNGILNRVIQPLGYSLIEKVIA